MRNDEANYTPPVTWLGRWLTDPGEDVPAQIRPILLSGLFGTLVIFFGGALNTIAVSALAACRHPTPAFVGWLIYEILLWAVRLAVLIHARHNARCGRRTFTDLHLFLGLGWSASVGYGSLMGLISDDWVLAALTTISAAAMAGGIALRNFYAPRLSVLMLSISLGPAAIGAVMCGEVSMWLLVPQVPVYLFSLSVAMKSLNGMLVRTIAAERENDRRAHQDQLTGLANRAGLGRVLKAWRARQDKGVSLAIFYLDLDNFKLVNDGYGHAAGDMLLRMVAERIEVLLPKGATAARIGGDEFVLVMPEADRGGTLGEAERIISGISGRPYLLPDGTAVRIGTCIGIARMPDHGTDPAVLLAAADQALYAAKAKGRCRAVLASGLRQVHSCAA